MRSITYKFYDPVFFADVIVEIKKDITSELSGEVRVETRQGKKGQEVRYVVRIESKEDFYTLQHECLHLVKQIFVDRGVPFNDSNDEAIAYYMEYWFKKIWRRINKK